MYIKELSFKNFRNLQEDTIFPHANMNVIYGENAQGKTNLLEAMWLFTGEKSFRGAKESEFLNLYHQDNCYLKLRFFGGEREKEACIRWKNGKREISINQVAKKGISAFTGVFCAVIFSPEHLSLIKGGPAERRGFIDTALCQIKPSYERQLFQYQHTLFQRNSLLKDIPKHPELKDTLEIWDDRLAKSGSAIIEERFRYVEKLLQPVKDFYSGISGKREEVQIFYSSTIENKGSLFEEMRNKLLLSQNEDISSGFTSCGPHRDDLKFEINGLPAKEYGSQGQQRSLILALKFAELSALQAVLNEPPVLFLDDVMSELDKKRQSYLLNHIHPYQVFITCCEPETAELMENGSVFRVESGKIVKE